MRFVKDIEIEGKKVKALFDTGAINTYVIKDILKDVPIRRGDLRSLQSCCEILHLMLKNIR